LSRSRLNGERLDQAVAELKRLGLGGPPAPPAAIAPRHRRRLPRA
jgi:hypothetical protein